MQLYLLGKTPGIAIYHDAENDWLFLDWEGDTTLPVVQEACLELARCFLVRPYPYVLNSNVRVTSASWTVAAWLVRDFLVNFSLAGVEQMAWVSSHSLLGRGVVQTVLSWMPGISATIFDDLEGAVQWLQQLRAASATSHLLPQRSAAQQVRLELAVQELRRKLAPVARPTEPVRGLRRAG